jgi:hypothetical protein
MIELTVQIKFTTASLGNQKDPQTGRFHFQRSSTGRIIFLASWHRANMAMAATILGRHQSAVADILWDIEIDAMLREHCFTRCFYKKPGSKGKSRWTTHESLMPGQTAGINCAIPRGVPVDSFWSLMQIAGQYKGLSPWQPGQWGHFSVESIRPRRAESHDE